MDYDWRTDPVFTAMEPEKYQFLVRVLNAAGKQDPKKLGAFFAAALQKANAAGIDFNDEETAHILQALSSHMSPAERKRMMMIQNMMKKAMNQRKKQ